MVTLSTMFDGDGAFQLEILKESLVGAIVDIDSAFSEVSDGCIVYIHSWLV